MVKPLEKCTKAELLEKLLNSFQKIDELNERIGDANRKIREYSNELNLHRRFLELIEKQNGINSQPPF